MANVTSSAVVYVYIYSYLTQLSFCEYCKLQFKKPECQVTKYTRPRGVCKSSQLFNKTHETRWRGSPTAFSSEISDRFLGAVKNQS